jgi:ketosteroid isomerase-like protein
MKRVALVALAAAALALAGCDQVFLRSSPGDAPPIAYGPETERQVERASQRYSSLLLAMDAAAVSEMYAPDGVMERQSGPLHGRDAIRQVLANSGGVRVTSMELITSYMSYNGPTVVQTGDFKQSLKLPNGKAVNASGRFEATWIHGPSGEWQIRRMVTRPNPSPKPGT